MKVLITPRGFADYGSEQIAFMKAQGLDVHCNTTGKAYTQEQFHDLALDADAIIVGVDLIDRALMEACTRLKVICKFGVGTDNIDVDHAKANGIYVGRTIGSNALAVAEHVVALMFAEAKHLYPTIKDVKEHGWNKPTGYEISGKSIGIIGFGAIGKHLARFAIGLDMKVYAYDAAVISPEIAAAYQVEAVPMDKILKECDYVSLHVPLLDSTRDMMSAEQFKMMKPDACLLNAARGGVVNEAALYEALVAQEIRSACFDVFSVEPPAADCRLLELDNFLLTPHTAARTVESEQRTCRMSADIIVRELLG